MEDIDYGVTMTIGGWLISTDGHCSHHDARVHCYEIALEENDWTPPELRTKWYQFWLRATHPEALIEALREGEK